MRDKRMGILKKKIDITHVTNYKTKTNKQKYVHVRYVRQNNLKKT